MTTKQEVLGVYNMQHGTNYVTVAALGVALATTALREAWLAHKRNEAHQLATAEVFL